MPGPYDDIRAELVHLRVKVIELEQAMANAVTHKWLIGAVLTLCGAMAAGAWAVTMHAAGTAAGARVEVAHARKELADDARQVRAEQAAKIQGIEAKTDGLYKLLVERKPREEVRAEVKRKAATTGD